MREEHKNFDEVMDVFGFRIVVKKVMQCYHALGAVHSLMKPLEGRFRDFIAIPKANGYQSLHTLLFGPLRLAGRSADPHRGNGSGGRARHRRALGVQKPAAPSAAMRRPARRTGSTA